MARPATSLGGPGHAGRWRDRRAPQLLGLLGVAAALLAWEALIRLQLLDPVYLPPPGEVLAALPSLLWQGPLLADVRASLHAVLAGTALACLFALPAAVLAHFYAPFRWLTAPMVELVRGIAPLALLPAFLLIFGLGGKSTIAIIVWVAWPPLFINVLAGLDATCRTLIDAARSMGANLPWLLATVYLPAVFGHLLAGLRLALGSAWLAVVAAEMLGANAGIGFRILEWSQTFQVTAMYGAIVVTGVVSLVINGVIGWLARACAPHLEER